MTWRWDHWPNRLPQLDKNDLETIVLLIREYGSKHIPIFSKKLLQKIEESLEAYKHEEMLLKRARENMEKPKIKTHVTWPIGTEYYSNGPFFE